MNSKIINIIKFGVIISIPMILLSVIAHVFNIQDSRIYGWLSILVFIITIFIIQRLFRQEFYDGYASYGRILGDTCLMLIFTAFVMFFYSYIFYKHIAPEEIEKILLLAEHSLEDKGFTNREIEQSMIFVKKINSPFGLSLVSLLSTYIQGLIISLLASIFNKKSQNGFSEAMKDIDKTDEN